MDPKTETEALVLAIKHELILFPNPSPRQVASTSLRVMADRVLEHGTPLAVAWNGKQFRFMVPVEEAAAEMDSLTGGEALTGEAPQEPVIRGAPVPRGVKTIPQSPPPKAILAFEGSFAFLSNFHPVQVFYDGIWYPSVEHAYQAAKTTSPMERRMVAREPTPALAKRHGKLLVLREGWDEIRLDVMRSLLMHKFLGPLKESLLATGRAELVEGNRWGGRFWGKTPNAQGVLEGENHLGKMLMDLRERLR